MNNYTTTLREYNLKATPQRIVILECIDKFGHINIDRLYEEVKSKFSSISLATIYKNINFMIQNMLLLEVKIPNQKSVYEIVKEQHSHLVCTHCGSVVDIKVDTKRIVDSISNDYQFKIDQSDLIFSGNCTDCLKKK
ncbi:MAG: Fur family peroxide stress response transcriptional regulator [Arcobacteraceae bacterium]|jgi:Fur family peroxide stress response transcriptional regulator